MKNFFLIFMLVGIGYSQATYAQQADSTQISGDNPYTKANITYKVIAAPSSTFGYDIYIDGKLSVHQTSRPALPGLNGFTTKEQAQKAAELVISKIKQNQMPPAVTEAELKKVGAL